MYVGVFIVTVGVVALFVGITPGWLTVAGIVLMFTWPEKARERRERAADIEAAMITSGYDLRT